MSVLLECVGYTFFELRLNVYEYIKRTDVKGHILFEGFQWLSVFVSFSCVRVDCC